MFNSASSVTLPKPSSSSLNSSPFLVHLESRLKMLLKPLTIPPPTLQLHPSLSSGHQETQTTAHQPCSRSQILPAPVPAWLYQRFKSWLKGWFLAESLG